jgi:3',5'-cyclic-AMP phosphodiesterase
MIIAQLSDTHIVAPGRLFRGPVQGVAADAARRYLEFDTAAYLERAVAALNALVPRPDVVIVTGDLVDHGEPQEYEHFRKLLAPLAIPAFVIPGNHDAREPLLATFQSAGYLPRDRYLQYVVDDYPLRLVALDTLDAGRHSGTLCAERLAWVEATLAARPQQPTMILMHHPPFTTGITYMDDYGLDNAEGLAEIVARHPQVERIVCGHLHRAIDRRFAGTLASTAPSTAHQVRLNLIPEAHISFNLEPAGYRLHLWQDGALITHTGVFGEWIDPRFAVETDLLTRQLRS